MNLNQTVQVGRVGNDPKIFTTPSGVVIAEFQIANSTGFGDKSKTTWHYVKAYNKTAETIEKFVKKGDILGVIGEYCDDSYEKDGKTIRKLVIVCRELKFGPRKQDDASKKESFDDDIPF